MVQGGLLCSILHTHSTRQQVDNGREGGKKDALPYKPFPAVPRDTAIYTCCQNLATGEHVMPHDDES